MAKFLFFGKLGDLAGKRQIDMAVEGDTVCLKDIVDRLCESAPELRDALSDHAVRVAVNEQIVPKVSGISQTMISDQDEIAFLPPVSGG